MAVADYAGIRDAIAAQIRTQVSGANVVTEMIPMMEQSPKVYVFLKSRNAPENRQALVQGQTTRFLVTYSVWVWAYAYHIADAMSARDALMAQVELAILSDVTFGRSDVIFSWQEGGDVDHYRQDPGFNVGCEIRLIVDIKANTTVVSAVGSFLLLEGGSNYILLEGGGGDKINIEGT